MQAFADKHCLKAKMKDAPKQAHAAIAKRNADEAKLARSNKESLLDLFEASHLFACIPFGCVDSNGDCGPTVPIQGSRFPQGQLAPHTSRCTAAKL